MKRIPWIVLGWMALLPISQAASFDCANAATKVERLICDDMELSKLDEDLSAAYKTALQDEKQSEVIKQAQKQWIKERNGCSDAACVKRAYETRLSSLAATRISSKGTITKQDATENSQNDQQYHFRLTKGKGVQVCDAYLVRLNTTEYDSPPYCDRPENDSVNGFALLHRVPLSPTDVQDLYPIVWNFMSLANRKNLDWADMNVQRQFSQNGQGSGGMDPKIMQMAFDGGWARIWGYDPPIDIDNDGVPDNVEMWEGSTLPHGVGGRKCGDDGFPITHYGESIRQPQAAFVITGNNDRLDVLKMEQIFAHPKGGYPIYLYGKWSISEDFRPIGDSIGIFKYQDLYYFDTFFDSWGDFESERQKDKNIGNTLGVFLRKDGKTRQVCEYLMSEK